MLLSLAEELRPDSLTELAGQEHLSEPGSILAGFFALGQFPSLIFWGPPGCGKTTLARMLIRKGDFLSREFSATVTQASEIKAYLAEALEISRFSKQPPVILVDEIHYFNRHLQDIFLSYIEKKEIILIGATTENPAYKINRALLSRLKVFELHPLSAEAQGLILERAVRHLREKHAIEISFAPGARETLFNYSIQDGRRLLNAMDLIASQASGKKEFTSEDIGRILQQRSCAYDRSGDDRYQLISAYHKSVRNSDIDSSLVWLAYMLERGEDPLYIFRRILRITAEDIGLADPQALHYCLDLLQAFEKVGMPEGEIFLIAATVYLVAAPKSNSLYLAEQKLKQTLKKVDRLTVPLQIINPDNILAAEKGAGKDYQYAHDSDEGTSLLETMPPEIRERGFFKAREIALEKSIRLRLQYWSKIKEKLKRENQ